jgi:hypothetical protein
MKWTHRYNNSKNKPIKCVIINNTKDGWNPIEGNNSVTVLNENGCEVTLDKKHLNQIK